MSNDMTDMSLKWSRFEVTTCWIYLLMLNYVSASWRNGSIKIAHARQMGMPNVFDDWRITECYTKDERIIFYHLSLSSEINSSIFDT